MLKRMLAFVTRRDGAVRRRVVRRLKSPRAAVYLEYAIVLPLAILLISTLIEFCALWDAKIMANHTAWTCARIASVEAGQGKYADTVTKDGNRLRTKGMKVATTLLMSTCSMGSMHGTSSEFTKHWFVEMIMSPLKKLEESFKTKLTAGLNKHIKDVLEKIIGKDPASQFVKKVAQWITDEFFAPLMKKAAEALASLFDPMFQGLGDIMDGNRQLRQLAYAAGRIAQYPDIVTVVECDGFPLVFAKNAGLFGQDSRLDYPRCLDVNSKCDRWFVTTAGAWPPNNQRQRMIDVKIAWPFERAWMFPVLSVQKLPEEEAKSLEGVPTAVGRALFYPQPLISNDNLKSVGATPFAPGKEPKIPDFLKKLLKKLTDFLRIAALYYKYQLDRELIGPFDSNVDENWSFKGIGLPVDGGPNEDLIYKCDGLVDWMGRAPSDYKNQNEWHKAPKPDDYMQCFRKVVQPEDCSKGSTEEQVKFWNGIPFNPLTSYAHGLRALSYRTKYDYSYGKHEWFYWGDGKQLHRRQRHKKPNEHKNMLKDEKFRRAFLIGADELGCDITREEYEAEGKAEGGVVPYAFYVMMRNRAPELFGSRVRTMIATWRPDLLAACDEEERAAVARLAAMDACQRVYDNTRKLIEECSKELDDAVGGKGKGADPGDPAGFFQLGGLDEEIMKNPKEAAAIIEKRLNEKRAKVFPLIKKVDDCEMRLRELDDKMPRKAAELAAVRRKDLLRFAVAVGRAVFENDLVMNPEAVRAKLLANHPWTGDGPGDVTRQLKAIGDDYYVALVNLYNAELELGKAIGCKSAEDWPPVDPKKDPKTPIKKPDADPTYPKPSSPDNGSDNDRLGDSWTRGNDGWTYDNGGPDL